MKNFDCIQTLKQMARILTDAAADGCPPDIDWDCMKDEYGWDGCEACWENWLRQPAEEDSNG